MVLKSPLYGLKNPFNLGLSAGGGEPFSVFVTGLSTDELGDYGEIGNHAAIGYTSTCLSFEDFGAVGDGTTDNTSAVEAFTATYDSFPQRVTLNVGAGSFAFGGAAAEIFHTKMGSMTLSGAPLVDGEPSTTFLTDIRIGSGGPPLTNNLSVRLEYVNPGDTTVTVKDVDPDQTESRTLAQLMEMFEPGQRVLLSAYDMMAFGYPANPGRFEFLTVASKTSNTITFTTPVVQEYPDDIPEYFGQPDDRDFPGQDGYDHGGPASLFVMQDTWAGTARAERIDFPQDEQLIFGKERAEVIDCTKLVNNIAPSTHEYCLVQGGEYNGFEVDKIIKRLDLVNVTVNSGLVVQSSSVDVMNVTGSTINSLNGTGAKQTVVGDSTITGIAALGATGYGAAESLTIANSSIPTSGWKAIGSGMRFSIGGAVISGATLSGARHFLSSVVGTVTAGETITGATSGATATVIGADLSSFLGYLLGDVVGEFTPGETVSSTSLTSAVIGRNTFGREWAVPGAHIMFRFGNGGNDGWPTGRRVTRFHKNAGLNVVTFDENIQTYADPYVAIAVHTAPSFTVNGCTGGDAATAYNAAPDGLPLGAYARFWITSGGVISAALPILGRLVSFEVNVTKAYTGALSNLFLEAPAFGWLGNRFDGTWTSNNADRFNPSINLKLTGTRTITPSGSTGLQSGEVGDDGDFIFSNSDSEIYQPVMRSSQRGTVVDLSAEDPSVYPEFTVTVVVDPFA